jgi:hypothetical protein
MGLSVVVDAYSGATLKVTLKKLTRQAHHAEDFKVVVGDERVESLSSSMRTSRSRHCWVGYFHR